MRLCDFAQVNGGCVCTFVCCADYAFHDGVPVHDIVVCWAEFEQSFVRVGLVGLQLGHEALRGGCVAGRACHD
jgi:hypothetical protein